MTTIYGDILVQRGTSGSQLVEALRHESVHRFLSPSRDGILNYVRARAGQWGYDNLHLLRFLEESIAQGYASKSLTNGISHAMSGGYRLSTGRIVLEATAGTGAAIGLGWTLSAFLD